MVEVSHGYPYFLQEWGSEVWNIAEASPIPLAAVEMATPRVIAGLDANFFKVRFDRLTPLEQKYLRAMAELGAGPYKTGEIAAALGVVATRVAPTRAQLIRKGMSRGSRRFACWQNRRERLRNSAGRPAPGKRIRRGPSEAQRRLGATGPPSRREHKRDARRRRAGARAHQVWSQRHGETAFTVPLFDQFMKRQMPVLETHQPRPR